VFLAFKRPRNEESIVIVFVHPDIFERIEVNVWHGLVAKKFR
jgi:hypothetical protein